MIEAFNALLECLVTGLFVAVFMKVFIHLGWLPVIGLEVIDPEDYDEEEGGV